MTDNVKCADFNNKLQIFETFTIEGKIEELKGFVKCPNLSVFNGKNIVIVVPSFDESGRYIEEDDKELYLVQESDANQLSSYLKSNTKANDVIVETNSDKLDKVVDSSNEPIDFLILLHEFTQGEKDYVVGEMKDNHRNEKVNENLQVIELY